MEIRYGSVRVRKIACMNEARFQRYPELIDPLRQPVIVLWNEFNSLLKIGYGTFDIDQVSSRVPTKKKAALERATEIIQKGRQHGVVFGRELGNDPPEIDYSTFNVCEIMSATVILTVGTHFKSGSEIIMAFWDDKVHLIFAHQFCRQFVAFAFEPTDQCGSIGVVLGEDPDGAANGIFILLEICALIQDRFEGVKKSC